MAVYSKQLGRSGFSLTTFSGMTVATLLYVIESVHVQVGSTKKAT